MVIAEERHTGRYIRQAVVLIKGKEESGGDFVFFAGILFTLIVEIAIGIAYAKKIEEEGDDDAESGN